MSRAFAAQTGSYVILASGLNLRADMPERVRALVPFEHTGQSCIIDPRGEVIAGPLEGEGILLAKGNAELIRAAKASIDIAGHYSRPDVFELQVHRQRRQPAQFLDGDAEEVDPGLK